MKKLLLPVLLLVILVPVYAATIEVDSPAQVDIDEWFTINVTAGDTDGGLQNIQIHREGKTKTSNPCWDGYYCEYNWVTKETEIGTFEYEATAYYYDYDIADYDTVSYEFTITVLGPNEPPTISIIEPDGTDDIADTSYTIKWEDSDSDNDAQISLFYSDDNFTSGTLIVYGLSEDSITDRYPWDTSTLPNNTQYLIYAKINDGVNPVVYDFNYNPITIIHAGPPNNAPVANDETYSIDEDITLDVLEPGILANDNDVDGDELTAYLVDDVDYGTLTLNSNGSFTYIPNADWNGEDSFTYIANDGQIDSNTATVTITVDPVNDAPVAVDDFYYVTQNTELNVPTNGVLANDYDTEGDSLTANLINDVSNGVLTLNDDGSFTYNPDTDFVGTDTFTYVANDGSNDSNIATVTIEVTTIPVNNPPTAVDDSYSIDEDTTLTISAPGVLANDFDVDGDNIIAILDTNALNGNAVLNSDGSFVYTPNIGFIGIDSFTYIANDGVDDSNIATVAITVNPTVPVNQPPVANAGADKTCYVKEVCTLSGSGNDPDGNIIAYAWAQVSGTTVTINNANSASATFTPAVTGVYVFRLTVTDDDGASDSDTITITVTSKKSGKYVSAAGPGKARASYTGAVPTISIPKEAAVPKVKILSGALELSEDSIKLDRGQTYRLDILIKNTGNAVATYNINIKGLEDQVTCNVEPSLVTLAPGKELTVYAYLTANRDAELGRHVAYVSLMSDSEIVSAQALIVDVQGLPYQAILFGTVLVLVVLGAGFIAFRR